MVKTKIPSHRLYTVVSTKNINFSATTYVIYVMSTTPALLSQCKHKLQVIQYNQDFCFISRRILETLDIHKLIFIVSFNVGFICWNILKKIQKHNIFWNFPSLNRNHHKLPRFSHVFCGPMLEYFCPRNRFSSLQKLWQVFPQACWVHKTSSSLNYFQWNGPWNLLLFPSLQKCLAILLPTCWIHKTSLTLSLNYLQWYFLHFPSLQKCLAILLRTCWIRKTSLKAAISYCF